MRYIAASCRQLTVLKAPHAPPGQVLLVVVEASMYMDR